MLKKNINTYLLTMPAQENIYRGIKLGNARASTTMARGLFLYRKLKSKCFPELVQQWQNDFFGNGS